MKTISQISKYFPHHKKALKDLSQNGIYIRNISKAWTREHQINFLLNGEIDSFIARNNSQFEKYMDIIGYLQKGTIVRWISKWLENNPEKDILKEAYFIDRRSLR